MERMERLRLAADGIERELFREQCVRLMREYQKQEPREQMKKAFSGLMGSAVEADKEAEWLGICILHTSLMTGSHEALLSVYGKEFYFDEKPVQTYWRPAVFPELLEEDMRNVMKRLKNDFPRIWNYEEEQIFRVCAGYYAAALRRLCSDMKQEIMNMDMYRKMKKTDRFAVFFGKYRGEGEILWRTGKI